MMQLVAWQLSAPWKVTTASAPAVHNPNTFSRCQVVYEHPNNHGGDCFLRSKGNMTEGRRVLHSNVKTC
jgi:hypothetical protein